MVHAYRVFHVADQTWEDAGRFREAILRRLPSPPCIFYLFPQLRRTHGGGAVWSTVAHQRAGDRRCGSGREGRFLNRVFGEQGSHRYSELSREANENVSRRYLLSGFDLLKIPFGDSAEAGDGRLCPIAVLPPVVLDPLAYGQSR